MAGRKPLPEDMKKVKLTITITRDTKNYLDVASKETGNNISELVEKMISSYRRAKNKNIKKK